MDRLRRWILLILSKWHSSDIVKDKYFKIDDVYGSSDLNITIIKGPYKDTSFEMSNIRIADDAGHLTFDRLITIEGWENHDYSADKNFTKVVERIFNSILREAINNYENVRKEILNDENDGTDHSEELTPKRTVYEKSNSVSKKRVFSEQRRKPNLSGSTGLHSKVQPPSNHGSDSDIFGK